VEHGLSDAEEPVFHGRTANFTVSYDPALGEDGISMADAILAKCEHDFRRLQVLFGGIAPANLPFNILITTGSTGASHATCSSVDLAIGGRSSARLNTDFVLSLVVAEEDEVFEASVGLGWDCGASNGEGLSRVLANELYPEVMPQNFLSAPVWLDQLSPDFGRRPDFITRTLPFEDGGDHDFWAVGCSVLFLNWLHFQLEFPWDQIIRAGAPTLDGVYWNLTGRSDALSRFMTDIETNFPPDLPSDLNTDQPFPLPRVPSEASFKGIQRHIRAANSTGLRHEMSPSATVFTGPQFAQAIKSLGGLPVPDSRLVLTGIVKGSASPSVGELSFDFSTGTDCNIWTTIPAALVETVVFLGKVACKDHKHDFVRLSFAIPSTDEGKVMSALLTQLLAHNGASAGTAGSALLPPPATAVAFGGFHLPTFHLPPIPNPLSSITCAQCIAANLALAIAVTAAVAALGTEIGAATAVSSLMARFGISQGVAIAAVAGASGATMAKMMCVDKHVC
jgi:hypothetical protein